jgi:hypothetical protein
MRCLPVKPGLTVTLPRDVAAPGVSIDAMGTVVGQMRSTKGNPVHSKRTSPTVDPEIRQRLEVDKD